MYNIYYVKFSKTNNIVQVVEKIMFIPDNYLYLGYSDIYLVCHIYMNLLLENSGLSFSKMPYDSKKNNNNNK